MENQASSIVELNAAPASGRAVICIPHAGAGAAIFAPLAKCFGKSATVLAARFPGREKRIKERPLTTIQDMARDLLEDIKNLQPENMLFFGYCSGAFVAYELVHMLSTEGHQQPESWLAVSGQLAPPGCGQLSQAVPRAATTLIEQLREVGGTPEKVLQDERLMRLIAPAVEADFNAVRNYCVPENRPRLAAGIAVLAGRDDRDLRDADIVGWKDFTFGRFRTALFDGEHFFLEGQEEAVAKFLLNLLGR